MTLRLKAFENPDGSGLGLGSELWVRTLNFDCDSNSYSNSTSDSNSYSNSTSDSTPDSKSYSGAISRSNPSSYPNPKANANTYLPLPSNNRLLVIGPGGGSPDPFSVNNFHNLSHLASIMNHTMLF